MKTENMSGKEKLQRIMLLALTGILLVAPVRADASGLAGGSGKYAAVLCGKVQHTPASGRKAKHTASYRSRKQKKKTEGYLMLSGAMAQLNRYRRASGQPALKQDPALTAIARVRAKELARVFSHRRPDGSRGLSMIPGNVCKGENLARGQADYAMALKDWQASPLHRANLLNSHFTKAGVAAWRKNGVTYWAQVFSS